MFFVLIKLYIYKGNDGIVTFMAANDFIFLFFSHFFLFFRVTWAAVSPAPQPATPTMAAAASAPLRADDRPAGIGSHQQ